MSREAQGTGGRSRAKPSRQNKEFLLSYYPHSGQQPRLQGILAISFPLPITFCIWLFLILKNLEKAMVTHSSTLAWKVPWTEEPGRLQSMGVAKSRTRLSDFTFHLSLSCIGEGNGNPLRCSCLENPRDGGAWRAAFCGVAQSRTRLSSSSRYLLRAHNNNCPCAFCKS